MRALSLVWRWLWFWNWGVKPGEAGVCLSGSCGLLKQFTQAVLEAVLDGGNEWASGSR